MRLVYLLDTCVFGEPIRRHPNLNIISQWNNLDPNSLAISAVCLTETLTGLELKKSPRMWGLYDEVLKDSLRVLPYHETESKIYARIHREQREIGKNPGVADLMIAATALAHDLILVTENTKDFSSIAGLQLDSWA